MINGVIGLLGGLKKYREIITVVVITVIGVAWTQKPFLDRLPAPEAMETKVRAEILQSEKRGIRFTKDQIEGVEKQIADRHNEVLRGLDRVDKSIHDLSLLLIRAYKEKALSGVIQGGSPVN